jgi:hypothetical protein
MFQAKDVHTTIASAFPADSAASAPTREPKCGVTRSQVIKRAWQLARLNRLNGKASLRQSLGRWIAYAWAEARNGQTESWTFLSAAHEVRNLEHQLMTLQYDDRRSPAHYARMDSLRASIRTIRGAL